MGLVQYVSDAGAVAGDYNNNGVVDAADYVLWRNGGPLQNEGRSTGVNDEADYLFWRARFGATASNTGSILGGGESVPEPAEMILLALLLTLGALPRGQVAARR
jgi:hypothetical protein